MESHPGFLLGHGGPRDGGGRAAPAEQGGGRYVVVSDFFRSGNLEKAIRWLLTALMLVVTVGGVALGIWYRLRLKIIAQRLHRKEVPYIQGEAIVDPENFVGRRKLLDRIRDYAR